MGALWVFDRTVDQLAAEHERLHSNGVAVEILSRKDVLDRWPELDLCIEPIDFEAVDRHQCRQGEFFLYEVEAGIADPAGANTDLIAASKREGVDVRFGIGVADIVTDKGRVVGVRLDNGDEVRCGLVVNAAGPWCNQINQMAGAQKRWTLTPTRVQLVLREWGDTDPRLPITFDGSTDGCYRMERSGEQILLVSPEIPSFMEATKNPDDFRTSPDRECVEATLAAFQHRAPGVRHVGTTTGICGLYTINEQDSHPIVGPSEIQGLWLANGFSGHGFKLAPGIGAMVARTITGAEAPYDPDIPDDLFAIDRTPLATSGGVFA
jgi:glycine/D-amino acid oxidase-like deaminating enzyme